MNDPAWVMDLINRRIFALRNLHEELRHHQTVKNIAQGGKSIEDQRMDDIKQVLVSYELSSKEVTNAGAWVSEDLQERLRDLQKRFNNIVDHTD